MGIGIPGAETFIPQRLVETLISGFARGEQALSGSEFWNASRAFSNCSEKFAFANVCKGVVDSSELLWMMVPKDVDFFQLVILLNKWLRAVCDTLAVNAVPVCLPHVLMSQNLGCLTKLWLIAFTSVLWKMLSWKHLLCFISQKQETSPFLVVNSYRL